MSLSDVADRRSLSGVGRVDPFSNIEIKRASTTVVLLTILTSFCGFMFGYDTGYISGALVVVGNDLGKSLTSGDKELITSATSLGAFIASLFAGAVADVIGRKWIVSGANIVFLVGGGMQTGAHTLWTMIAGRFIMGFGVGIASLVAPVYISELAPARIRGRLVVLNVLAITFGQLVAYGIGAGLETVPNGWRILVGLSLVPSVIQMVFFVFMPETPRYLVRQGKTESAKKVLKRVYVSATEAEIDGKILELSSFVQEDASSDSILKRTLIHIKELHTVPSNFRALIITCGLQGIQQFSGWNALMYFSATVFQSVGFNQPVAVSIIIAGTNFVFTIVALLIIDRIGRRRLLLFTIWGMALGLVLNAIAFHFLPDFGTISADNTNGWSVVVIIAMLLFAAFYGTGIGNVPWQQSEMFPMNVRGVGSSFATATNWAGSLVVSSTFLTMLENITPTGTFAFYAGLCVIGEIFVFFFYPETAGLKLEEIQELLDGGFNIKLSIEKSREAQNRYKASNEAKESDSFTSQL